MPKADDEALRAFIGATIATWAGEPAPRLVPAKYWAELAKLPHGELADVAWHLAQQLHDLAGDPQGDMIELRCAIEFVQERRRPSAVTLRRRD